MTMHAFPPLPTARTTYGRPGFQDFAFGLRDPEGMLPRPPGYHGAVDWFAAGRTPVKAARQGIVVEVAPSRGNSGQVFGGTVKVRERDGTVWVYRHVDPLVPLGCSVDVAGVIAKVTAWRGGPSHLHLEVWRTLEGGYNIENALDPEGVIFTVVYSGDRPPPPHGDSLRLAVNGRGWAGWEEAGPALMWIERHGLRKGTRAAIAWRGDVWRGARQVEGVARNLVGRFL